MVTATKATKEQALADLREMIKPGDTVYTKMIHASRSGMYRVIDLYVMRDNEPWRITWTAAVTGEGYDTRHEGAKASGCGMDMGFHLVYNLSYRLFPNGFDCIGTPDASGYVAGCPSNDHSNRENNEHHKDGGYALIHRWL